MIELHSAQLQIQKLKQFNSTSTSQNGLDSTADSTTDIIQKKLDEELQKRFNSENSNYNLALLQADLDEYKKENEYLRTQLVQLNSEVYGARLAAKYLDKELAGMNNLPRINK